MCARVRSASVESSGADLFSDGTTQGKGALSSGTLTLTVHTAPLLSTQLTSGLGILQI